MKGKPEMYYNNIQNYGELLCETFELSVEIKSVTRYLYSALQPCSCIDADETLNRLSIQMQTLYDNLRILMDNFNPHRYECSADHILGHYIKAFYLVEAGIELVKSMKMLYSIAPDDFQPQALLLRGQMELISFVLRYLENAVREYRY